MGMIKRLLFFSLLFASFSFADTSDVSHRITQDFLVDLGTSNFSTAAMIYLYHLDEDISGLTFESYVSFLKKLKPSSAENVDEIILQSDKHFFFASKKFVVMLLYYEDEKYLILDDSETNYPDVAKYSDGSGLEIFFKKYLDSKKIR